MLGIASYGLFGAAVLHAALLANAERRMRLKAPGAMGSTAVGGMPLLRLERLTFQFVAAGFATLSATLVLGWWFAEPWRWDHKTVFSLLGWFVFAGLLAGRHAFGWRGRRAAGWLYAGAALLDARLRRIALRARGDAAAPDERLMSMTRRAPPP